MYDIVYTSSGVPVFVYTINTSSPQKEFIFVGTVLVLFIIIIIIIEFVSFLEVFVAILCKVELALK